MVSYLAFGERSSIQTILSCCVIVIGYIEGIEGELHFSRIGTLFGLAASTMGSLYTIFVHRYLKNAVCTHWELCYYNNLVGCLLIPIVGVASGEYAVFVHNRDRISSSYLLWSALGENAVVVS